MAQTEAVLERPDFQPGFVEETIKFFKDHVQVPQATVTAELDSPALFLSRLYQLPDSVMSTEHTNYSQFQKFMNDLNVRFGKGQKLPETITTVKPITYNEFITRLKPLFNGSMCLTADSIDNLTPEQLLLTSALSTTYHGDTIISLNLYHKKIDTNGTNTLEQAKPVITVAPNDRDPIGAFLIFSADFNSNPYDDNVRIVIGRGSEIVQRKWNQWEKTNLSTTDKKNQYLREPFSMNDHVNEPFDDMLQAFTDTMNPDGEYFVTEQDARAALRMALKLQAATVTEWSDIYNSMQTKKELLHIITFEKTKEQAITAMTMLFEPLRADGTPAGNSREEKIKASVILADYLKTALKGKNTWSEITKVLEESTIKVIMRTDDDLLALYNTNAPNNSIPIITDKAYAIPLSTAVLGYEDYVLARIKTLMGIRQAMARGENILGPQLHALIQAHTDFQSKRLAQTTEYYNAAAASISIEAGTEAGTKLGAGVTQRIFTHAVNSGDGLLEPGQFQQHLEAGEQRDTIIYKAFPRISSSEEIQNPESTT